MQAGGSEVIQRIDREGQNSPADVFLAADAAVIGRAHARKLFRQIDSDVLNAAIPENLREPGGHWYSFAIRARVIVYAKDRVKPDEITTYEDLADPKWKGRLLVNSSSITYNQSLVASLIAKLGAEQTEAWAKSVVDNMARPPKGGDRDLIAAVYAREADLAVVNTYYFGHLLAANAPGHLQEKVGVIFPDQQGRGPT